jgi:hypothetical protein
VLLMIFDPFRVHHDIIKVDNVEDIQIPSQRFINIRLKSRRGIYQAKRYDRVLEMAIARTKRRLLLVSTLNIYIMIDIT